MSFQRNQYGENVNAGVNANDDHGWGGHQWPAGVPGALLAVAIHGDIRVTVRRELVELFVLFFQLAQKFGYPVYARNPNGSGEVWGPWSYENRPIGGTSSASNHSRGRAVDVNAPMNPQSYSFESNMPPALVRAWESIGFSWGGRYGGGTKYDTMHFEYAYSPSAVPVHIKRAWAILGDPGSGAGVGGDVIRPIVKPKPVGEDEWLDMGAKEEIIVALGKVSKVAPPLQCVKRADSQAVFAYGRGTFVHIVDGEQLNTGRSVGYFSADTKIVSPRALDVIKHCVLLENYAPLASALGAPPKPAPKPAAKSYIVVKGDTFGGIAKKLSFTEAALAAANPALKDRNAINIGQVLNLPK